MGSRSLEKGKLSDPGFVELTEVGGYHAVVLLLGGFGQRQEKARSAGEVKGDSRIFRSVCAGKLAGVLPILHILAVSFEDSRVGSGL